MVERRAEIRPPWPFRMPTLLGADGVTRRRNGVVMRLVHIEGEPAVVRAAQPSPSRVVVGARADRADVADEAVARFRFALGVDDDLSAFHERFRFDPLIGPVVRSTPWLRPTRRPDPFEALAWAITEQLIDYPRAAAIQRQIVRRLGRRCPRTGLRDLPTAERLGGQTPALLESFDLAHSRACTLVRVAREVASGRLDLRDPDHERGWRRLRAMRGVGSWTIAVTAFLGQGRHDVVPAGDLNFLKLVGRLATGSPHARATEEEVLEFFAPYAPWSGLAATYCLRTPVAGPLPARTRSSAPGRRPLAA